MECRAVRVVGSPELVPVTRYSDTAIQELNFRNQEGPDPPGLRADLQAGASASLIGIAAYLSIERGGGPVKIAKLVKIQG